jgi:hypothetical protein
VKIEPVTLFDNDVGVVSILSPAGPTIQGFTYPVSARVSNFGTNDLNNVPVNFRILDSTGTEVYSTTSSIPSLPSHTEADVSFTDWTPGEPNLHTLISFTSLVGDEDQTNDTTAASTTTYPHRSSGGPVEDWSYLDNLGGGPAFSWVDITTAGTPLFGSVDDDNSGMIDMGMTFSFFGTTYDRLAVCTNGWISFIDSVSTDYTESVIPNSDGPGAMIALLWDDLHTRTGNVWYYFDAVENQFIVQWDSVEYLSPANTDLGMEVILDSDDNSIKMQYLYFVQGAQTDCTVGIENVDETLGLPYDNSGEIGQTPFPGLAITWTYNPLAHDVAVLGVIAPNGSIIAGQTYDIVASVTNAGSSQESFTVTATDNHGFINTQNVVDLPPFGLVDITFPGWTPAFGCSTYTVAVTADLSGDEDPANNTANRSYITLSPSNHQILYDDGVVDNAWRFVFPFWVIANQFDLPFQGTLQAVTYQFTNLDNFPTWPDDARDTVELYIFTDADNDGFPDATPVYSARKVPPDHGPLVWGVACETDLEFGCQTIWAGWAMIDSLAPEGICMDATTDYPSVSWTNRDGIWAQEEVYDGDDMIQAYFDADFATAPDIAIGDAQLNGSAPVGGADTTSTTIDNVGAGCNLEYTVRVVNTYFPLAADARQRTSFADPLAASARPDDESLGLQPIDVETVTNEKGTFVEPEFPPMILGSGGPDIFGYVWIDSDEEGGPTFSWIDITLNGTEITPWPHGSIDDGYTDLIPMGMTFNFYGFDYSDVTISTNGWVSFFAATTSYLSNTTIPNTANPNAIICPEWDDLDGGTLGHCYYYYDAAQNQFIVSWEDWDYYPDDPAFTHDLQIILNGDGTILCQYRDNGDVYQSDITVGIENETGTDGLQVANAQDYLHNDLALKFVPPVFWLSTDLADGVLPPADPALAFNVFMSAAELDTGTYNGAIVISSNDPDEAVTTIPVVFVVVAGGGGCEYVAGDINGNGSPNGIDVTFGVAYFKGGNLPPIDCNPPCTNQPDPFYAAGDVNGNCTFNGIDITYFVAYLKGSPNPLTFCPDCPPAALAAPAVMPGLKAKTATSVGSVE